MDMTLTQRVPLRNMVAPTNSSRNNENQAGRDQNEKSQNSSMNFISAKTYFFTGTAEKVLAWNRVFKQRCLYEVIASLVSYRQSDENCQNILLLKDKKGPILQVINYYEHETPEKEFVIGQTLRCAGYMTGINTLVAVTIRRATPEEVASLKRYCYIGDFAISGLMNAEENLSKTKLHNCFDVMNQNPTASTARESHHGKPKGAVVSNGPTGATVGASILNKGGTAVEAAIAMLFCEGVTMPHNMGIGGGFFMTIYNRGKKEAVCLNARETAPAKASENMFEGDLHRSTRGGLAVAVPAEVRGYWEAYQKFGNKTPWKDLVQPAINLCKEGIVVTRFFAQVLAKEEKIIKKDAGLREIFINPKTGKVYVEGQHLKRPKLAKTLELIAEKGPDVLYNGELTEDFVKDIRDKGGIITVQDMQNYTVEWQKPVTITLSSNQTLYTTPPPSSGVILGFIMNILDGFLNKTQPNSILNWHRIIESFKLGFAKRSELGDTRFVNIKDLIVNLTSRKYAEKARQRISDNKTYQDPKHYGAHTVPPENNGTAHLGVLAPNGDAVSVNSTINLNFGAGFISESTGIILNNQMDDFSSPNFNNSFGVPPSVANYIKPGKRPLSSMCPCIVTKDADVKLVIGAAGGTKIISAVAQVAVKNLWFDIPLQEAVSSRRLHHQLFPMSILFEQPFSEDMDFVNALHELGHEYDIVAVSGFTALTAISRKDDDNIQTAVDPRRRGESSLIY